MRCRCLTKKAEPPPTRDGNRDSGTASANGGWLRRLVRRQNCDVTSHSIASGKCVTFQESMKCLTLEGEHPKALHRRVGEGRSRPNCLAVKVCVSAKSSGPCMC